MYRHTTKLKHSMSYMPGDHISVNFSNVGHEKESDSMMFPLDGEENCPAVTE